MITQKIISIVTTSFNQANYLYETMESVVTQKGDFYIDYVVIDGKSSDNSVDIIKGFESLIRKSAKVEKIKGVKFYRNPTCKCSGVSLRWISEPDTGHGVALNKGFSRTVGDYMAWINSDDKYHYGAYDKVVKVFSEFPSIDWIIGKYSWWDEKGKEINEKCEYKNIYDFLNGNYKWIQQESTFWRRALWEKAGSRIDDSYKFMVDGELWCRYFLYAKPYFLSSALSGFRVHGLNRSKIYFREIDKEMERAIAGLNNNLNTNCKKKLFILNLFRWAMFVPVDNVLEYLFPKLYETLNYDLIVFENKQYKLKKQRYSIFNLNVVFVKNTIRKFFKI